MQKTPQQIKEGKMFQKINEAGTTKAERDYSTWMKTTAYKEHIDKCITEINKLNTKKK